ncbi:cytochrome P450 [Thamnidium elegans]|uniref:Cytochrome P450 n=1 Tax=Thamnidium elegans TaxID=101142 RepID=A0A8H7VZY7_9FUNG|nr:hypothetical protein INT48_000382 [Thamnidium elegans]KAI8082082.1 cytochrome P450 [Thamnidium elegans]BDB32867.1 cytochrome P450 monooxygenase [Thamnidium elegans]
MSIDAGFISIAAAVVVCFSAFLFYKYPDSGFLDPPRKSIPYKKGLPLLGNLVETVINIDRYYEYVCDIYEELDTFTFRFTQPLIPSLTNTVDPKNVEHILKTNFENYEKGPYFNKLMYDLVGNGIFGTDGEVWRVQRKVASRIFHVKNFRDKFTRVFLDQINIAAMHVFDKAAEENQVIDFHDIMLRFTMDSFAQIGFSVQLNSLISRAEFADSFDALQMHAFRRFLIPFTDTIERIKHYTHYWAERKSIQQHVSTVNSFAYGIIQERRKKDLLHHDEDSDSDLLHRFMTCKNVDGNYLSDTDLRDTVLNFIIAGRDTTALALSWTFYNLLMHPEIEEKVLQEVQHYITDDIESDPVRLYETVQKMTYTHAVFYEVLRLYPSVPGEQKEALNDDVWPDGTQIRKGDQISWQPFVQGRITGIWGADAKEFKPQRWISDEGSLIRVSPYQWTAFNAGPRVCLGQNLATLEAIIAISFMLKRYKFKRVEGHQVIILNLITLSMKDGMKITVEKRQ